MTGFALERPNNPAQPVSGPLCPVCGEHPIVRAPGSRGPLPRRCDVCRDRRRTRQLLLSRLREVAALCERFRYRRQARAVRNTLAELESDDASWTGAGE